MKYFTSGLYIAKNTYYTWCLKVWNNWKGWKKSEILEVGLEVCKKSGNFTNISKKFGKKNKK